MAAPVLNDELLSRAVALRYAKQFDAALALFRDYIARRDVVDAQVEYAYEQALFCLSVRKAWDEIKALGEEGVSRAPRNAVAHQYLGEALWHLQKDDEAKAALERAIELDPALSEARQLLAIARRGRNAPKRKRKIKIWPVERAGYDDPRALVKKHLLAGDQAERFIRLDTKFMTLGSCFATEIANALQERGYDARTEIIGEEVNSTFANRYLLEWIERGPAEGPTAIMEETYGPEMRARFRDHFQGAAVVVMTLGVAPCFFDEATGAFAFASSRTRTGLGFLHAGHVMRTTSVAENVNNIRAMIPTLKRLCGRDDLKIVLTVSPVPLQATTEFDSVVMADCLSKSTLRLACHEAIVGDRDNVLLYWPSFEIVRWLGVNFGAATGPAYAAEDGSTRHVSRWLIALIMELFVDEFMVREDTGPLPTA